MSSPSNQTSHDIPPVLYDEDRLVEVRKTGILSEKTIENFNRLTQQAVDAIGASAGFFSVIIEEAQPSEKVSSSRRPWPT